MTNHIPITVYSEVKTLEDAIKLAFKKKGTLKWFHSKGYAQLYKVTTINTNRGTE